MTKYGFGELTTAQKAVWDHELNEFVRDIGRPSLLTRIFNQMDIEQEIQDKGLTAPRVTPADIEAEIVAETYFTAAHGRHGAITLGEYEGRENPLYLAPLDLAPLDLLTFCVLVLKNGFTVTGESACASPENFDAEIGRKIARQNAVAKIWPLLGFRLHDRLAGGE